MHRNAGRIIGSVRSRDCARAAMSGGAQLTARVCAAARTLRPLHPSTNRNAPRSSRRARTAPGAPSTIASCGLTVSRHYMAATLRAPCLGPRFLVARFNRVTRLNIPSCFWAFAPLLVTSGRGVIHPPVDPSTSRLSRFVRMRPGQPSGKTDWRPLRSETATPSVISDPSRR